MFKWLGTNEFQTLRMGVVLSSELSLTPQRFAPYFGVAYLVKRDSKQVDHKEMSRLLKLLSMMSHVKSLNHLDIYTFTAQQLSI